MSVGRIATKHTLGIDGIRQLSKNVDPNLTRDNVILADELRGRTIEEYTNDTFQPAIDEYNARQKRSDRKIKTPYVEWHKNNGNLTQGKMSLAYECVIQIGEHESLGHQYYEASGKKREQIHRWYEKQYSKLLKDFKERFPHLKVLYAAIHFDEKDGTPHMHLCFQPQAVCTRGLGLQVSIGKALGQDGIPRFENRLEAEREGYQMGRMYKEFRHQYINPLIEKNGFEVKQEVHGRKHEDKSYFKDKMKELDQREEEFNTKKQAAQREYTDALDDLKTKKQEAEQTKQQLDEREKRVQDSESQLEERELQIQSSEKKAAAKMQRADLALTAAKQEQQDAIESVQQATQIRDLLNKEIKDKQTRVDELKKSLKNTEDLLQTQDAIDEIFKETGSTVPFPKVYSHRSRGWGENRVETVEIGKEELDEIRKKAASYEIVQRERREAEKAAKDALKAADKDETIKEVRAENLALKMELQKTRVERNQARRDERSMEISRDEAIGFIADRGLGQDFLDEHNRDQDRDRGPNRGR